MKFICNIKQFKKLKDDIEELFRYLITTELCNCEAYYGTMPDDALKAGCDGTASIIIEDEKDLDYLMKEYKFDILNGIPEFINVYNYKKNVFYSMGFLCTNEFMVIVFLSKRTLDRFSDKKKEAIEKLISENSEEVSQEEIKRQQIVYDYMFENRR